MLDADDVEGAVAFGEATVGYNPVLKPEGTIVENIQSIRFQIPTNGSGPVDWDFCINDMRMQ